MERGSLTVLIWSESGQRYALPLQAVVRAVRMVAIARLPSVNCSVLGCIVVEERLTPVISAQSYLRHAPPPEPSFEDQLLLAAYSGRTLALLAHSIEGLAEVSPEWFYGPGQLQPTLGPLSGVFEDSQGPVLVPDLEALAKSIPPPGQAAVNWV